MTQALYAHMNNKRKRKKKNFIHGKTYENYKSSNFVKEIKGFV
jgi:hypothetical protein